MFQFDAQSIAEPDVYHSLTKPVCGSRPRPRADAKGMVILRAGTPGFNAKRES